MKVCLCSRELAKKLVMDHHYSGRMPGVRYCWGLLEEKRIVGCVVYSTPASYTLCNGVCGKEYREYVLEFSRLVILTRTKNAASFLIASTLRMLPNSVVVSYADCNEHVGHVGYVYQATNWLYTGHGNAEPVWIDPRDGTVVSYTRRHIDLKAEQIGLHWSDLTQKKQLGKHRYVTFTGDRKFRKKARAALRYEVRPYPKGNTRRHEGKAEIKPEHLPVPRSLPELSCPSP